MPEIIADLKLLIQSNPSLKSLRRVLPYFQYIAEKFPEALKSYKELCLITQAANDWYNLAALALKMNDILLTCYALEQVFTRSPLQRESPEWYIYLKLIKSSENYFLLKRLYASVKANLEKDEEDLFLETCIYILKRTGKEDAASLLIRSWYQESPMPSLIENALSNFGDATYNPYKDILSEITSLEQSIANERKKSEPVVKPQPSLSNPPAKPVSNLPAKSAPNSSVKAYSAPSKPGLYKQAKDILDKGKEKEKAISLLKEAIEKGDNPGLALGQLVSYYSQLNEHDMIISLLETYKHVDYSRSKRINALTEAYWQKKDYQKTIEPLTEAIKDLPKDAPQTKRVYRYQQMASCYMHLQEFKKAQEWWEKIIKIKEDYSAAKRNIAICLIHLGDIEGAKEKLKDLPSDEKAAELLDKINNVGVTEATSQAMQSDKNQRLVYDQLTPYSLFFLERCKYEGARDSKRILQIFDKGDVTDLEWRANDATKERPLERAEKYLSAAKICFEVEDLFGDETFDRGRKDLCRSFIARGDAAAEKQDLDAACEWYSEALKVYGEDKGRENNDGITARSLALVNFIYASAGKYEDIPWIENDAEVPNTLESFLADYNDEPEKIFRRIVYLIARSKYAAEVMLNIMYEPSIREKSLEYLQKRGIYTPTGDEVTEPDFHKFWQRPASDFQEKIKEIYIQLNSIEKVELASLDSVEDCRRRIDKIEPSLDFPQDATFLRELKTILSFVCNLCKQTDFDGKNDSCRDINKACQDLLRDIELKPTILSIEKIHSLVSRIQQDTEKYHQHIKQELMPHVTLRLPDGKRSQTVEDRNIRVQIVIENEAGRRAAVTPKLLVDPGGEEIRYEGLLRGGKSEILTVPLTLTDQAINEKAFSLSVRVQYRTNLSEEPCFNGPFKFSIRLDSSGEFKDIPNPYSIYAGGRPVEKEEMFLAGVSLLIM